MRIYTSHYNNYDRLQKSGIILMGITFRMPRNIYVHSRLRALNAPKEMYLYSNGVPYFDQEIEEFTANYRKNILGPRTPQEVIETLKAKSKELWFGADIALCTFELPGEFSHRHIVADWLNEYITNPAEKVREYVHPSERFGLNEAFNNL